MLRLQTKRDHWQSHGLVMPCACSSKRQPDQNNDNFVLKIPRFARIGDQPCGERDLEKPNFATICHFVTRYMSIHARIIIDFACSRLDFDRSGPRKTGQT
jgi:hypothetical protein